MHHVFVCHATEDVAVAADLRDELEAAGVACWMAPRDIESGANWVESIVQAIDASRLVVLVLSDHANGSQHVVREVEQAVDLDLPLIPVRMDQAVPSPTLRYLIGTAQWLDADPGDVEATGAALVAAVRRGLAGTAGRGGPQPPAPSTLQTRRWSWVVAFLVIGLAVVAAVLLLWPEPDDERAGEVATTTSAASSTSSTSRVTTTGVTVERPDRGVIIYEGAIDALTPYANDLATFTDHPVIVTENGETDRPGEQAALLGAWWGLADWCRDTGQDPEIGTCYDLAAAFLVDANFREPRELNDATWGAPGAIGGVIDQGYMVSQQYLGLVPAGQVVLTPSADHARPGVDVLCEPDCHSVLD